MSVDVLHVINGLDVGGAERSLTNLMLGGLADTTSHGIITLQDRGAFGDVLRAAGVPVWCLGVNPKHPSPLALARFRKLVKCIRPKVLQGWMYHSNLAAALVRSTLTSKPKLAWNIRQTLHSLRQEKLSTRWVIRAHGPLAARADVIIYNCVAAQRQHEQLGIRGTRSEIIPNGVDTNRFKPSAKARLEIRDALGIPHDALVVGHAARWHAMKDHATLLAAAKRVTATLANVHFVLAGPGVHTANPDLAALLATLDIPRIHVLGERTDMPGVLASLDVLCSSSAWGEGFPNAVAEAMACGVPCVATDLGASAEIIADTGRLTPPGDPDALAVGLLELLRLSDPAKASLAARQRILDHYSIDRFVSHYRALYARLLGA